MAGLWNCFFFLFNARVDSITLLAVWAFVSCSCATACWNSPFFVVKLWLWLLMLFSDTLNRKSTGFFFFSVPSLPLLLLLLFCFFLLLFYCPGNVPFSNTIIVKPVQRLGECTHTLEKKEKETRSEDGYKAETLVTAKKRIHLCIFGLPQNHLFTTTNKKVMLVSFYSRVVVQLCVVATSRWASSLLSRSSPRKELRLVEMQNAIAFRLNGFFPLV